jgi:hypothetical protein
MYRLTGQPGWMRFGFSPGWIGRSPTGLGPCAQFLLSGQAPRVAPQATDPEARLEFLKSQAGLLEEQLKALRSQIESMEGGETP